jgi:hypothetical protein
VLFYTGGSGTGSGAGTGSAGPGGVSASGVRIYFDPLIELKMMKLFCLGCYFKRSERRIRYSFRKRNRIPRSLRSSRRHRTGYRKQLWKINYYTMNNLWSLKSWQCSNLTTEISVLLSCQCITILTHLCCERFPKKYIFLKRKVPHVCWLPTINLPSSILIG